MKKTTAPSSALVPLTQSLPALTTSSLPAATQEEIEKSFREELKKKQLGLTIWLMRACLVTTAPMVVVSAVFTPGVLFFPIVFSMQTVSGLLAGSIMQKDKYATLAKAYENAKNLTREKINELQTETYNSQKQQILETAERHLANGKLLSEDDLAWLVHLDPAALKGATEELAITTLQVRQLLAHTRGKTEEQGVPKPLTFAGLDLSSNMAQNRLYLADRLKSADAGLVEDTYPVLQDLKFTAPPKEKIGILRAFKELLIPFSDRALSREYKKAQLPQVEEIVIQVLSPAVDFAAALETYEAKNPPLDLPAMRGWKGGTRRAIAGPKVGL